MTLKETAVLMGVIATAYPRYYHEKTEAEIDNVCRLWHEMFAEYPAALVSFAVKNVIKTSPYPPTVADVVKQIELVTRSEEPSDAELWSALYTALCDSTYHSGEQFAKLPPECKEFAGSPGQLKDMGQMDIEKLQTVTKSLFLRQLPILRGRRVAREEMPDNIRRLVQGLSEKMRTGGHLSVVDTGSPQPQRVYRDEWHID